jgi:hypothetical protein
MVDSGTPTLRDDGERLVRSGLTTTSEILRVVSGATV